MVRRVLLLILFVVWLLPACSQAPDSGTPTPQPGSEKPKVQWVDAKSIQPGSIRRDSLTDEQMVRLRKIHTILSEVDGQSVEKWAEDFKRDADPDRELAI
jgi:hypothetical protein